MTNVLTDTLTPAAADAANKPQGVPEKFWDAETGEIRVEDLLQSYLALEKKLSGMLPSPDTEEGRMKVLSAIGHPEAPDAYEIDVSHGL